MEEDSKIVENYRNTGDSNSLAPLYEKYSKRIYAFCLKKLRNKEDAEEATSKTFLNLSLNINRWKPIGQFHSWLFRIAQNECINIIRDHMRERAKVEPLNDSSVENIADDTPIPGDQADEDVEVSRREELRERVQEILSTLNDAQRECFCLHYFQKKTYQEIAEYTGFTWSQVHGYIQYARKKFIERWKKAERVARKKKQV